MLVTHIMIAAATTEAFITGSTTLKKVARGDTPRLIDASSSESGMLNSIDEALRTENGARRTT